MGDTILRTFDLVHDSLSEGSEVRLSYVES